MLLAILVACAGCRAMSVQTPASQPALLPDANAELTLQISTMPFLTAEAAYRAVYLLREGSAFDGDFDALSQELVASDVVSQHWQLAAGARLNRAKVGRMICRVCGIRSGLNWRLTGLGRYAWRELQYRGICRGGSELNLISGGEFLGILHHAERFVDQRHAPPDKPVLGTPPGDG